MRAYYTEVVKANWRFKCVVATATKTEQTKECRRTQESKCDVTHALEDADAIAAHIL